MKLAAEAGPSSTRRSKAGAEPRQLITVPDMVRLATEVNAGAIERQKLKIGLGEADSIPYPDGTFTCASMTGVLLFLPDALATFKEVYRVLGKDGRFVIFTGTKETRGTPASPEPIASRLHFYEDAELLELAKQAGFSKVRVDHPDLGSFARDAGLTEQQVSFFSGKIHRIAAHDRNEVILSQSIKERSSDEVELSSGCWNQINRRFGTLP